MLTSLIYRVKTMMWGPQWQVRRCEWPYPEGYATYNVWKRVVLDTGLTEREAEQICEELNKERR